MDPQYRRAPLLPAFPFTFVLVQINIASSQTYDSATITTWGLISTLKLISYKIVDIGLIASDR